MDDVDSRICTACMDGVYYFKVRPIEYQFILIIIKQNWNQFLFVVKATALKQQISKFYPQIQHTYASDHVYVSQRPVVSLQASF